MTEEQLKKLYPLILQRDKWLLDSFYRCIANYQEDFQSVKNFKWSDDVFQQLYHCSKEEELNHIREKVQFYIEYLPTAEYERLKGTFQ